MKLTYYKVLTPSIIFDKTIESPFGDTNISRISANTELEVTITKRAVTICIQILGFGLYLEFKHGDLK